MNDTPDATAIFAPLWKRKWLILAVAILVAAGTYEYYKRKTPVYTATTQLYVGSGSEQQSLLSGGQGKGLGGRGLTDQVGLINSAIIGEPVHKQLRKEHNLAAARGKAKAIANATSDFITITTEAHTPRAAVTLANAYARAYIKRQHNDYLRALSAAIANTRRQLLTLESGQRTTPSAAKGKSGKATSSPSVAATIQAANLNAKLNQLESNLSVSGVQQVSPARASPLPISPKPKQNAIFGFVLGLVLASIAAYALSRFDRRLRSLGDIETIFEAQILTALPTVRRSVVRRDGQTMPSASLLEPLRRLHTTLALGDMLERNREASPRSILFLSADSGDGKSTLVADLALVQRDAGECVAVIEADFRRPVLANLLDVDASHGLAQVLAGTASIGEAMQAVQSMHLPASPNPAGPAAGVATVVESRSTGSASVLVSGGPVANPPALLGSPGMMDLLRSVAEDFDYVLIDAPPPLEVSDVMPLLHSVDGIVIVARIGHTRETSAERLMQLLRRVSPAPVLGIVANHVPRKDIERYGLSSAPQQQRGRRRLIGR